MNHRYLALIGLLLRTGTCFDEIEGLGGWLAGPGRNPSCQKVIS